MSSKHLDRIGNSPLPSIKRTVNVEANKSGRHPVHLKRNQAGQTLDMFLMASYICIDRLLIIMHKYKIMHTMQPSRTNSGYPLT